MFTATESQRRLGLALLRIVVGAVFVMHGWQKFTQMGHAGVTGYFTQLGAPAPAISAWVVMVIEVACGTGLILGVLTRLCAFALACDMIGAILLFHSKHGFFVPDGVEFVMTLLAACIAFIIAGAGTLSIDDVIAKRRAYK